MPKKLTLQEIKEKLKTISPNIEILSKEYISAHSKMMCKCLVDGYEWGVTWSNLFKGSGCPMCSRTLKLTLQEIKERLLKINSNIEILSDEYVNAREKLKCKCKIDGHIWNTPWFSLLGSYGCPRCANNIKLTLEEVKERLLEINPNIEILSDKYINGTSKLKCRCLIDNHIWGITWNDLRRGQGCPKCYRENNFGENHHSWKGGVSPLRSHLSGLTILQWKKDSFKKYNYKCDITGKHNVKLIIHHYHNFSNIVQETMDILNLPIYQEINQYTDVELKSIESTCLKLHYKYGLGVCISEQEHILFHSIYGRKNNTIEQYEKFKQKRVNELMNKTS